MWQVTPYWVKSQVDVGKLCPQLQTIEKYVVFCFVLNAQKRRRKNVFHFKGRYLANVSNLLENVGYFDVAV